VQGVKIVQIGLNLRRITTGFWKIRFKLWLRHLGKTSGISEVKPGDIVRFGLKKSFKTMNSEEFKFLLSEKLQSYLQLKVVGNEKVGGSRRWHMIDIGLGSW
jgi:hypothetical protein